MQKYLNVFHGNAKSVFKLIHLLVTCSLKFNSKLQRYDITANSKFVF